MQANGAGVRGPSSGKEQHLPPGVEMGRNGPEHRPGSETPQPPLVRSGRRAGRKSVTLTPPLPQRFPDGSPLPSTLTPQGGRGRTDVIAGTPPSRPCRAGPAGGLEGGKEVGLEEESESLGGTSVGARCGRPAS